MTEALVRAEVLEIRVPLGIPAPSVFGYCNGPSPTPRDPLALRRAKILVAVQDYAKYRTLVLPEADVWDQRMQSLLTTPGIILINEYLADQSKEALEQTLAHELIERYIDGQPDSYRQTLARGFEFLVREKNILQHPLVRTWLIQGYAQGGLVKEFWVQSIRPSVAVAMEGVPLADQRDLYQAARTSLHAIVHAAVSESEDVSSAHRSMIAADGFMTPEAKEMASLIQRTAGPGELEADYQFTISPNAPREEREIVGKNATLKFWETIKDHTQPFTEGLDLGFFQPSPPYGSAPHEFMLVLIDPSAISPLSEDHLNFIHAIENSIDAIADEATRRNQSYEGRITLRLYRRDQALIVEVNDNGIGIPPKTLRRLFRKMQFTTKDEKQALGGKGVAMNFHFGWGLLGSHGGRFEIETRTASSEVGHRLTLRYSQKNITDREGVVVQDKIKSIERKGVGTTVRWIIPPPATQAKITAGLEEQAEAQDIAIQEGLRALRANGDRFSELCRASVQEALDEIPQGRQFYDPVSLEGLPVRWDSELQRLVAEPVYPSEKGLVLNRFSTFVYPSTEPGRRVFHGHFLIPHPSPTNYNENTNVGFFVDVGTDGELIGPWWLETRPGNTRSNLGNEVGQTLTAFTPDQLPKEFVDGLPRGLSRRLGPTWWKLILERSPAKNTDYRLVEPLLASEANWTAFQEQLKVSPTLSARVAKQDWGYWREATSSSGFPYPYIFPLILTGQIRRVLYSQRILPSIVEDDHGEITSGYFANMIKYKRFSSHALALRDPITGNVVAYFQKGLGLIEPGTVLEGEVLERTVLRLMELSAMASGLEERGLSADRLRFLAQRLRAALGDEDAHRLREISVGKMRYPASWENIGKHIFRPTLPRIPASNLIRWLTGEPASPIDMKQTLSADELREILRYMDWSWGPQGIVARLDQQRDSPNAVEEIKKEFSARATGLEPYVARTAQLLGMAERSARSEQTGLEEYFVYEGTRGAPQAYIDAGLVQEGQRRLVAPITGRMLGFPRVFYDSRLSQPKVDGDRIPLGDDTSNAQSTLQSEHAQDYDPVLLSDRVPAGEETNWRYAYQQPVIVLSDAAPLTSERLEALVRTAQKMPGTILRIGSEEWVEAEINGRLYLSVQL
ncbi:MAG: hypothetical protein HY594_02865 [Candidatus Omnitrophica bacterium]|nr:hypothetical protein [Candidatus Omnitrophota bacterium]